MAAIATEMEYEFTDTVVSWSRQAVLDKKMFKLETIPEIGGGVDEYMNSYSVALLEETRAAMEKVVKTLSRAPCAKICKFQKQDRSAYAVLKIREWSTWNFHLQAGDIVMISDKQPGWSTDEYPSSPSWRTTFALVDKETEVFGKSWQRNVCVRLSENVEKPLYLVYIMSIMPYGKIWDSLSLRQKNQPLIQSLLTVNPDVCELCPPHEPDLSFLNLNKAQTDSISSCLSRALCSHTFSVELITGLPGTGKTTTLIHLLYCLLKMKVRTIVLAPTMIALHQLASGVMRLISESDETETETRIPFEEIVLFGDEFDGCRRRFFYGESVTMMWRNNIFMFGDTIKAKVGSWVNCLVELRGHVQSLLTLLEDLGSGERNQIHDDTIYQDESTDRLQLEFEKLYEDSDYTTPSDADTTYPPVDRDKFLDLAARVRECLSTFMTHLPRSFSREHQQMLQCMSILNAIEVNSVTDELLPPEGVSTLKAVEVILDRIEVNEFYVENATLLFCKSADARNHHRIFTRKPVHMLVMDDAPQVKEIESIPALQIPCVQHVIMAGDTYHLAATTIISEQCDRVGLGRSLFERLSSMGHPTHLLNMQYRMHPSIVHFPNREFYNNLILNAPNVESESYQRCYLEGKVFGHYSFIEIPGDDDELVDSAHSEINNNEVAVVRKLVKQLYEAWNGSNEELSIGLIVPYAAQVRQMLGQKFPKNVPKFLVDVATVEGCLGEYDIVILVGCTGFWSSPRRLNVALTRARHSLWVIGSGKNLRGDRVWADLIQDARQRACFFTIKDVEKIVRDCEVTTGVLQDLAKLTINCGSSEEEAGNCTGISHNAMERLKLMFESFNGAESVEEDS